MGVLPGAEWIAIGTRNGDLGMISETNSTLHYYHIEGDTAVIDMETWREQYTDNMTYYEENRLTVEVDHFTSVITAANTTTFRALPFLCSVDWDHNILQWNNTRSLLDKVGIFFHTVEYLAVNVTIRNSAGQYSFRQEDALLFEITYENSTNWEEYTYLRQYGVLHKHSWNMFDEWGTWETKILKLSTRETDPPEPVNPFIIIACVGVVGSIVVIVAVIILRWLDKRKEGEMLEHALKYRDEDEDDEW